MPEELVTVATFEFLPEAETAKSILQAEGLTVFLADAELVTTNWLLGAAVGHIKLQVPGSQAQQAAAVIEELRAHRRAERARDEDQEDQPETTRCLACGASLPEDQDRCPACGWSYEQGGEP